MVAFFDGIKFVEPIPVGPVMRRRRATGIQTTRERSNDLVAEPFRICGASIQVTATVCL